MKLSTFLKRLTERSHSSLTYHVWDFTGTAIVNFFVFSLLFLYLGPMLYLPVTALKLPTQMADPNAPLYPADAVIYEYQNRPLNVYIVPTTNGERHLALVKTRRTSADFIDPENPQAGIIHWDGNWRALNKVYVPNMHTENFTKFFGEFSNLYFPLVLHTLIITFFGLVGVIPTSIAVAYGFSRFRIPGIEWLFILLIATILIPETVTLVPTYRANISLVNWVTTTFPLESVTWLKDLDLANSGLYRVLPVLVQHYFGNAIFIFLLRQKFKSIPRDLDEAAMIDGAGPLRILVSIVLPQSIPVVSTIVIIHFFYSWNEIRQASLYLAQGRLWMPASFLNSGEVPILLTMIIPVMVLFLVQPFFMKHVPVIGNEK